MTFLAKQSIELPLIGGINQKEGDLFTQRPEVMHNCLYRKTGEIEKRYGYECIGRYNASTDGYAIPEPQHLQTFQNELIRIGSGKIHKYATDVTGKDWIPKGRVSEANITYERKSVGETKIYDPTIAKGGNYIARIYLCFDDTNSQILYADLFNYSTNTEILTKVQIATGNSVRFRLKVIYINNKFVFFWHDVTSYVLKYKYLDLSTMTFSSEQTFVSVGTVYDMIVYGDLYIVRETTSGTNRVKIERYSESGGVFSLVTSYTVPTTDTGLYNLCIDYNGSYGAIAWSSFDGSEYHIYTYTFNSSLTSGSGPLLLQTYYANYGVNIAIKQQDSNLNSNFMVVWSLTEGSTGYYSSLFWAEITTSNVLTGSVKSCLKLVLASKLLAYNKRMYCLTYNRHSTHSSFFLLDLNNHYDLTNNTSAARLVSQAAMRQGVHTVITSEIVSAGDYFYAVGALTGDIDAERHILGEFKISFDQNKNIHTSNDNMLILSGGTPSVYDGDIASEIGFAWEMDVEDIPTPAKSGSGSLTADAIYSYRFVYEWIDSKGRRTQSIPSGVVTVDLGAADTKITITLPALQLSNKKLTQTGKNKIRIAPYRTTANGSIFYRVPETYIYPDITSVAYVWSDTTSDTNIQTQEKLYTEGGVVDNVMPPSATLCHVHKRSVFLAGTDDDSIWISKEILPGESPAFNDTLVIPSFEGGRVTGLATLDDYLVIFKESGVWIVNGEPPNDLGVSSLSSPQRISADVGCSDPKSIVSNADGVFFFAGKAGLQLLTRAQQIVPVGKQIEDSINYDVYSNGSFAGAVVVPNQDLVRFIQRYSNRYDVLNYDYYHSRSFGTPVWSFDTLSDPLNSAAARVRACTMWNNAFVWIGGSNGGTLYRETTSQYYDSGGSNVSYVSSIFESAFEKALGVGGFQRVFHVLFTMKKSTDHGLSIILTSDFGTQQEVFTTSEVNALPNISTVERVDIHCQYQKVSWLKVMIADTDPGAGNRGTGKGMTLQGITVRMGAKAGFPKLAARARK